MSKKAIATVVIVLAVIILCVIFLKGCRNTKEGIGQDVGNAGGAVENVTSSE